MKSLFSHTHTHTYSFCITTAILGLLFLSPLAIQVQAKDSRLKSDPEIIQLKNYIEKPIKFITLEEVSAYATKKGAKSRQLGTFKPGQELTLTAMTEKAYRVSGKSKHGKLNGWVNPKKLSSKDPEFIKNLKYLYKRQILVNELVSNQEVAIGMTSDEVLLSLGEPSKKRSKVTKDGKTESWDFIEEKEIKHYNYFTDPVSGQLYKRYSHTTTEEQSKTTVEFENNVVSTVSMQEDNRPRGIQIINPPLIFIF